MVVITEFHVAPSLATKVCWVFCITSLNPIERVYTQNDSYPLAEMLGVSAHSGVDCVDACRDAYAVGYGIRRILETRVAENGTWRAHGRDV